MIAEALTVVVLITLTASPTHSRSAGAPVAACADILQQHPPAPVAVHACGPPCPFRIRLISIDGVAVPAGEEGLYRCGGTHTCKCPLVLSRQSLLIASLINFIG